MTPEQSPFPQSPFAAMLNQLPAEQRQQLLQGAAAHQVNELAREIYIRSVSYCLSSAAPGSHNAKVFAGFAEDARRAARAYFESPSPGTGVVASSSGA